MGRGQAQTHCLWGWGLWRGGGREECTAFGVEGQHPAPLPVACGRGKWVSLRQTGRPTNSQACLRLRVGRPLSVQTQFQINSTKSPRRTNEIQTYSKKILRHINRIQLSWSVVQTGLPTLGWSNCLRLSFGANNFVFGAEICLLWAIKILFGGAKKFSVLGHKGVEKTRIFCKLGQCLTSACEWDGEIMSESHSNAWELAGLCSKNRQIK